MEANEKLDDQLLKKLFENGLMGIEIPEEYGGTGSNFMTSILAVEEIAKVDPAVSVLVDIQNTLINSLIIRLGTKAQKEKYLTKLATESVSWRLESEILFLVSYQFVNFRRQALHYRNHHREVMRSLLKQQLRRMDRITF